MTKVLGMALLLVSVSGALMASAVPEIDAASGVNALALVSGALLIVRGRRKNG